MGFYIELEKISETEVSVQYRFFNLTTDMEISANNTGIIELDKVTEEVIEIQHAPNDKNGLVFERAAKVLAKCWKENVYPEKTCWAS